LFGFIQILKLQQKTCPDLTVLFIEACWFGFGVQRRALNRILALVMDGLISAARF
jgi:hypothetical protein